MLSLAEAEPAVFWLDDLPAEPLLPALTGAVEADLVVVGGGYTGLWTALQAKEDDPDRDVVLVEARTIGWAASGRNGGFCASSLTHGEANGIDRFPDEFATLERLGRENLDGIADTITRHRIDAEFERTGELDIAVEDWQLEDLRAFAGLLAEHGSDPVLLDREQTQALVHSPTYLGSRWDADGVALVHPAKLARGLGRACQELGVRVFEHTEVSSIATDGDGLRLRCPFGTVRAGQVALATNAFTGLLRRLGNYIVPVYDYALVTEPLSAEQRRSIGWEGRQGLADLGNQFHYYRLTADNRILWGGYDVIYHFGNQIRAEHDQRLDTFAALAEQFFDTFPQLEGLRFSHRWGGVIDTCSRFTTFWGKAYGGRLAYAAGYTGLGVGASRFGARVMLDLLDGADNERSRLEMVRSKPLPFPPEPFRYAGIQLTRRAIDRADRNGGRRNLWLRALDKVGLGFES
ncbi:FAD-dependent oxidoreductase [Microlunatus ginsengisoli]|uniref:FAD-dependent oxidoreductase n=2 Tax=Microlunatus ginsengisoli TaxID=363863 RepID=A0ABP6ZKB6_9ACTN